MSLSEAIIIRDEALAAYRAALSGKSYSINTGGTSRNYTRQEVDKLLENYQYWQGEVQRLQGGRKKVFVGVPRC